MLDAMFDTMKQTLLMGVGLAAMTKDKAEQWARDVASQAKLSAEKGQEFVKEVSQRAEKAREDLQATVRRMVDDSLRHTSLATRDQLEAIEARLARLEDLLSRK